MNLNMQGKRYGRVLGNLNMQGKKYGRVLGNLSGLWV